MGVPTVTFAVVLASGEQRSVKGLYAGIGLAVHECIDSREGWRVSNTTTGRCIPYVFDSREAAMDYAELVADLIDWEAVTDENLPLGEQERAAFQDAWTSWRRIHPGKGRRG